ncbi:UNVERIFIED_CONTAM: hypothetical protein K2H54_071451 [Gekko kuhli]
MKALDNILNLLNSTDDTWSSQQDGVGPKRDRGVQRGRSHSLVDETIESRLSFSGCVRKGASSGKHAAGRFRGPRRAHTASGVEKWFEMLKYSEVSMDLALSNEETFSLF